MSGLAGPPPFINLAHTSCPQCDWALGGDSAAELSEALLEHTREAHAEKPKPKAKVKRTGPKK